MGVVHLVHAAFVRLELDLAVGLLRADEGGKGDGARPDAEDDEGVE